MYCKIISIIHLLSRIGTGIIKRFVSIDDEHQTVFCYYERGIPVQGQPTIVFIHGFSGNKGAWVSVVKNIPQNYHCIMIDLPYHGETSGCYKDDDQIYNIIHKLKPFFDKLNLTTPFCLVGTSMGSVVASLFSTIYPEYIGMICLMAPPPCEKYESELLRQVRHGNTHLLLPATSEQFHYLANTLLVRQNVPKIVIELMYRERVSHFNTQKKLLESVLESEYMNLDQYYKQLRNINCPILILWGREDKVCVIKGMNYFSELISHAEVIVFDNCGHFIVHDKTEETAKSLTNFVARHSNQKIKKHDDCSMKSSINLLSTLLILCLFFFLYFHI